MGKKNGQEWKLFAQKEKEESGHKCLLCVNFVAASSGGLRLWFVPSARTLLVSGDGEDKSILLEQDAGSNQYKTQNIPRPFVSKRKGDEGLRFEATTVVAWQT